jgi:hypothetical protein
LRGIKEKTLATLMAVTKSKRASQERGCCCERVREHTLEHYNQVRRGEEEEEVNLPRFLSSDQSVFKLVFGGSNVLGLAPNLVSSFLSLSTSIWLHSLRFGSVEVQI